MIDLLCQLVLAVRLAGAIVATSPDVPPERALVGAWHIVRSAGQHEPALVAAIAIGESRLDWRADNGRGCFGPGQVCGRGRPRSEAHGYAMMVRRLDEAVAYCLRAKGAGNWTRHALSLCTLAGYASGPAGVRGRWYRQPRAVLRRVERLRAAMCFSGCSVSGRPAVSKSANGGSIPSHPAKQGASS